MLYAYLDEGSDLSKHNPTKFTSFQLYQLRSMPLNNRGRIYNQVKDIAFQL